MSTQLSNENRKQPPSIYSVMLFLSMLFLLIAVIAMIIEMRRWAPDYFRTNAARPTVMLLPADDVTVGQSAIPSPMLVRSPSNMA